MYAVCIFEASAVQIYAPLASCDMIKLHAVVVSSFCGSMNIVHAVEYKVHYIFSMSLNFYLGRPFHSVLFMATQVEDSFFGLKNLCL